MVTCRRGEPELLSQQGQQGQGSPAEPRVTHVYEILMEAFPQVVQEGALARVGVQEDKVLDAHSIPGVQGGLHVPQDLVAPFLQALHSHRSGAKFASLLRPVFLRNYQFLWKSQTLDLCFLLPTRLSLYQ